MRSPSFQQLRHLPERVIRPTPFFVAVTVFTFVFYWLFAAYVESVNLLQPPGNAWESMLPLVTLPEGTPAPVAWFISLIWWRVLRHFIPVAVGWWLAYQATTGLLKLLYGLSNSAEGQQLLQRLRSGTGGRRSVTVTQQNLEELQQGSALIRVGGPGRIKVPEGYAAVTERNGRFWEVVGAGTYDLIRLERLLTVLDLRPQTRTAESVVLRTKDGIDVTVEQLSVRFRIRGSEPVTSQNPYPYDRDAVRAAAYAETVGDDNEIFYWDDAPLQRARGILGTIFAQLDLDELLIPQQSAMRPARIVQRDLQRKLSSAVAEIGLLVEEVSIGRLDLPQPILDQYLQVWRMQWQMQAHITRTDGQALAAKEREVALSEAELNMIQAILEGVERAQRAGSTTTSGEIVALRLIEALEKVARESGKLEILPPDLLPKLDDWRKTLRPGGLLRDGEGD